MTEGTQDYQKYQSHYIQISKRMVDSPVKERTCTNFACVIVFIIILAGFIGLGIIQLNNQTIYRIYAQNSTEINVRDDENKGQLRKEFFIFTGIGLVCSIIISYLYVFLLSIRTQQMVYFMIFLSLAIIASFVIAGIITANIGLSIGMGIVFLMYAFILFCYRQKIKIGINLVKIATKFIFEKKIIFLTPILKLILTFLLGFFFIYVIGSAFMIMKDKYEKNKDDSFEIIIIIIYTFCWILFTFIFYYMMSFTISLVCSNWYYRTDKTSLINAYAAMFKQFGSIVFAALVISIITFARMVIDSKRGKNKNLVVEFCLCLISCFLRSLEALLKVLNHYTIIMIALTGQGYIDGAKSTMGLLWKQLPLLYITNFICNILVFCGGIISVLIPTLITYGIMLALNNKQADIGKVVPVVAVCSLLISVVIFEIVVESTSCIFIYYSIDKDFFQRGLILAKRIPEDAHNSIDSSSKNAEENNTNKEDYQKINS